MSNWLPSASIEALRERAALLSNVRNFFNTRGYLEVETPCMGHYGCTDVYLNSIAATFRNKAYYLQTSPEYHMKRLLAAGSGPIFQLARVFRDDELGRWHNPEFTLLEWYQLNWNHHQLLDEVEVLLQEILKCPPLQRITYRQAFLTVCQIDPITADCHDLKEVLRRFSLSDVFATHEQDIDKHLFLLMSHVVEPFFKNLPEPLAILDFPASQAALAQVQDGVAARFEVYFRGIELANGFHELTDVNQQRSRFLHDQQIRVESNFPPMQADERLLSAMESGLPACSGVALGIERLIALSRNDSSLQNSFAFDFSRA